jgi:hypothetical protein
LPWGRYEERSAVSSGWATRLISALIGLRRLLPSLYWLRQGRARMAWRIATIAVVVHFLEGGVSAVRESMWACEIVLTIAKQLRTSEGRASACKVSLVHEDFVRRSRKRTKSEEENWCRLSGLN